MTTGLSSLLGSPSEKLCTPGCFLCYGAESQTHSWAGDTCFTGGQTAETHRGYNGKTGFKPTSGCLKKAHSVCSLPSEESQLEFLFWNFREKLLMFPVSFSLAPGERFKGSFGQALRMPAAPSLGLVQPQPVRDSERVFYREKMVHLIYFILQIEVQLTV